MKVFKKVYFPTYVHYFLPFGVYLDKKVSVKAVIVVNWGLRMLIGF